MRWFTFSFRKTPKSFLGIDIGTSAIRVVELTRSKNIIQLSNYGELSMLQLRKIPTTTAGTMVNSLASSAEELAEAIKAILREAEIITKEVSFSIPDFSSFFTSFDLPSMSPQELEQAVRYEARSYIPLPLSEITLDWKIINSGGGAKENQGSEQPIKVLVAAISNEVINQYRQIATLANLKLAFLEAEVFTMQRSVAIDKSKTIAVIDIGARSTTCNVFRNGILKISHSFNVSGNALTEVLSKGKGVDYLETERLKKEYGLSGLGREGQEIKDIMMPLIDVIVGEAKKTFLNFIQQDGTFLQEIWLVGGSALMPGLKEYFTQEFNKEARGQIKVEIANPFTNISFPPILTDILKEMGPSYAIAVGSALKGFE